MCRLCCLCRVVLARTSLFTWYSLVVSGCSLHFVFLLNICFTDCSAWCYNVQVSTSDILSDVGYFTAHLVYTLSYNVVSLLHY